jgi:DNA (cytosine-5)-methyltransferase 1
VSNLILSLFPGIGLLDMAFEEEGFCVVRGPDLLWGGDIRRFHPSVGDFVGIIGGPPCQWWSGLGAVNRVRWGEASIMPDMIPDFARVVNEAEPEWYLMENVPQAPAPVTPAYRVVQRLCDNRWCGGEQRRLRRFTFGACGSDVDRFHIETSALLADRELPTVISTGQNGRGGARASVEDMAKAQGIDPARFEDSPFTRGELRRAIANGVPLPLGRAVAKAVKRALESERQAA